MNSCVDPKISKYFDTFVDTLRTIRPSQDIPVFIGISSVTTCSASKYILYNTEQLTIMNNLGELLKTLKTRPPVEVWDYSLANISLLHSHGIMNTKHVPLTTSPETIQKIRSFRTSPQYHIGFNGALTERRKKILDGLTEAGVSVHTVTAWGDERDRELAKCRYILNIHAGDEYMVFESARCAPWLDSGIPVISEHSIIDDPRCITASYDKLIDTCIHQLRNTSEGFSDYTESYRYLFIGFILLCGLKFFTD
jgi:hypothetical protein